MSEESSFAPQNVELSWIAAFIYLFGLISGLITVILEESSRYLLFHGYQSLFLALFFLPILIILIIIDIIIQLTTTVDWHGYFSIIWILFYLCITIFMMIKAYQLAPQRMIVGHGTLYKLPIIGNIAEKKANEKIPIRD